MLRESAKTTKEIKDRKMYTLSKRIGAEESKDDLMVIDGGTVDKRKKDAEGKPVTVSQRPVALP